MTTGMSTSCSYPTSGVTTPLLPSASGYRPPMILSYSGQNKRVVQHDQPDALVEERQELRLLRVGDVLDHVVKHDDVEASQVVAVVGFGGFRLFGFGERDRPVVCEHFEEWFALETMSARDDEHVQFCATVGREHCASEE